MNSLSATVRPPILAYYNSDGSVIVGDKSSISTSGVIYNNLFDYHSGPYSHSVSATAGYDTMEITISTPPFQTRQWISEGIGNHIEVYGSSGIVWEGFVNQISINIGPTTINIGPLIDIANRISVSYTTKRWNTNPPIGGDQAQTSFDTVQESINRWGTFEKIISGGEGYEATMEALRDSKLTELSWPIVGQDFGFQGGSGVSIQLSCLGYYHYLGRYMVDTNTAKTGDVNISEKLGDVLDADPDSLFSSASATITSNTLQVPDYDDGTRNGMELVQELVGLGFSAGRRALFMVGKDRHVTYEPLAVDKDYKYVYSIYDESPSIRDRGGSEPALWDISAGEWVKIQSTNAVPFSGDAPRNSDPSLMFTEKITFTAPDEIKIEGGLGSNFKARLATYGLGFTRG